MLFKSIFDQRLNAQLLYTRKTYQVIHRINFSNQNFDARGGKAERMLTGKTQ